MRVREEMRMTPLGLARKIRKLRPTPPITLQLERVMKLKGDGTQMAYGIRRRKSIGWVG
jgi:hypothetical protein